MLNPSTSTLTTTTNQIPHPIEAARHICQEARNVLSSLRSGPPHVARGELAQGLRDVRLIVKSRFLDAPAPVPDVEEPTDDVDHEGEGEGEGEVGDPGKEPQEQGSSSTEERLVSDLPSCDHSSVSAHKLDISGDTSVSDFSTLGSTVLIDHPGPPSRSPSGDPSGPSLPPTTALRLQVGNIAFPFLAVILDPRAAGPHTLVALRSIHRLLARHTFLVHPPSSSTSSSSSSSSDTTTGHSSSPTATTYHEPYFLVSLEPLVRGILECRFEQTDAGADEAVEMAIADLLSLMVSLDYQTHGYNSILPNTLMDAFNTVFVTRNTFVHSPALCYHFEEVLDGMVTAVFREMGRQREAADAAELVMEFLVGQLLHTPLLGERGVVDGGNAEAHAMHDATRLLCLRLIQSCLRIGWGEGSGWGAGGAGAGSGVVPNENPGVETETSDEKQDANDDLTNKVLKIVQDDLCLSLLVIGQSIWTYLDQERQPSVVGTMISTEVLSEICSIFSTLWNIPSLRRVLSTQFENILTGFYQRALSLLRKLPIPNDSATFHANHIFDAEMEIILESLVDILCLHDGSVPSQQQHHHERSLSSSSADKPKRDGGALENIFSTYDCALSRSDVSSGLLVELCRCCGGTVNAEGITFRDHTTAEAAPTAGGSVTHTAPETQSSEDSFSSSNGYESLMNVRHVPAHLRELCAEALVGSVKSLFYEHRGNASDTAFLQNYERFETCEEDLKPIRHAQQMKRQMRRAAELFNKKPTKGIEYLVTAGILTSKVTPGDVADFLRNGIVHGLDKAAVGSYLGEEGKPPTAGGSPPSWQRDYFHKEALQTYCSSFHFENQSLLEGLRMFLAAFRLPGEAQQIDRILQAFAENCGRKCAESQEEGLRLFRGDPKKASDGAYLLSFSIILLNTDLHNANIRADRKMTVDAFLRNNTNYGRDITDPGCELPKEYLTEIYERIQQEPIRTEGEGADGVMTLERWKDVLRNGNTSSCTSSRNSVDVRQLIMEKMWMPVLSAIGGFWGVTQVGEPSDFYHLKSAAGVPNNRSGMLGAQGARLGMDLSVAMLTALRNLSCTEMFQNFFHQLCMYTGLLKEYNSDGVERTASFINSVERQSAVIIILNTAVEYGGLIGFVGWKMVWGIVFELRDLKLLGGGTNCKHRSLIMESDLDLLCPEARRDWSMFFVKDCLGACGKGDTSNSERETQKRGLFSAVGRAIFGSENDMDAPPLISQESDDQSAASSKMKLPSSHGKEELILWDDLAASDVEDELDLDINHNGNYMINASTGTVGNTFENHLIQEDNNTLEPGPPITGLETYEDTRIYQISPRARVRKRLSRICNFSALVSETRFLDIDSVETLVAALASVIRNSNFLTSYGDTEQSDITNDSHDSEVAASKLIISPASEALAEVLLCEIALKNRDRIGTLWKAVLKDHYFGRLRKITTPRPDVPIPEVAQLAEPGFEKCLTGLLRICYHTAHRDDVNEEVLQSLKILYPPDGRLSSNPKRYNYDKQLAEGAWRICCDGVDGLRSVSSKGWQGILGLIKYCAARGEPLVIRDGSRSSSLADDDPAFKSFRCLHYILNSEDLSNIVPFDIVHCIQALVAAGERQNCPKLSIAGLDLFLILHSRLQPSVSHTCSESEHRQNEKLLSMHWYSVVEGLALASASRYASVRQHSIAMLIDALIDRHGQSISIDELTQMFSRICIPTASERISELLNANSSLNFEQDEIMIELELCVSVTFKPFIHHICRLISRPKELETIWMSIISIVSQLLGKESNEVGTSENQRVGTHILSVTKELAAEHLRNAIMVLASNGVIGGKGGSNDCTEIESLTWNAIEKIGYCEKFVPVWKNGALY